LRNNPCGIWYANLQEVSVDSEHEVTFHLSKPQPTLIVLLASGMAPVYPCHVSSKDMRINPIGTGPFKFVEFKSNDTIKLVHNPYYWKPGRPYLDAIEWRIMSSRVTRPLIARQDWSERRHARQGAKWPTTVVEPSLPCYI